MITNSKFKPKKYLSNTHFQSMWPTFIMKNKPALQTQRERLELPDGDFIDLEWHGPEHGPIIILLHGVTGEINSPYVKYSMPRFAEYGWRSVLMYYRGFSGEDNRSTTVTHAGHTDDFRYLVETLQQREPNTKLAAIGYSMGANILLKYLGEQGNKTTLETAVAVSPPFQLRNMSNRIRHGTSRFYQWYLLKGLRKFYHQKFRYRNAPFDIEKLHTYNSFWSFDDKVTAPVNGFKGAVDYYRQASCLKYLIDIKKPTLIIHAIDDSIMTPDIIPAPDKLSPEITLELSAHGGHLGFVDGTLLHPTFWLNQRIPEFLSHFLPNSAIVKISDEANI